RQGHALTFRAVTRLGGVPVRLFQARNDSTAARADMPGGCHPGGGPGRGPVTPRPAPWPCRSVRTCRLPLGSIPNPSTTEAFLMSPVAGIRAYFEANGGRPLTTAELRALTKEELRELADLAAKVLGLVKKVQDDKVLYVKAA